MTQRSSWLHTFIFSTTALAAVFSVAAVGVATERDGNYTIPDTMLTAYQGKVAGLTAPSVTSTGSIATPPSFLNTSTGGTIASGPKYIDIRTGGYGGDSTCLLTHEGAVYCWGKLNMMVLGNNADLSALAVPLQIVFPSKTSQVTKATALAVGGSHACAVLDNGSVWCWGDNGFGQLGNLSGKFFPASRPLSKPVQVQNLGGLAKSVTAGIEHSCALLVSGAVQCWGWNADGQLGISATVTNGTGGNGSFLPLTVPNPKQAVSIAADGYQTCALAKDTTVWCWGNVGGVNVGGNINRNTPTQLKLDDPTKIADNITSLTVDILSACGIRFNKAVCWTRSVSNGRPHYAGIAWPFSSPPKVLSAGGEEFCGVAQDGSMVCWRATLDREEKPVRSFLSPSLSGIIAVNTSFSGSGTFGTHGCAILKTDQVACWGDNFFGQLGVPIITESKTPVFVQGLP